MRKCTKLTPILLVITALFASLFMSFPTFATDSSHVTETVFFGNVKDDGSACGVFTILNTVVDIMSIGIGILAIIGITIVGIKYLTAGGNEEQTRKAKHRMFQIVIGLVVYAALYAGIQFLLPGGKLDFSYRCATISDEELAQIKAEEAKKRAEEAQRQKSTGGSSSDPGSDSSSGSSSNSSGDAACLKNALPSIRDKICGLKSGSERIAKTAELLAFSSKKASKHNYSNSFRPKKWSDLKKTKPNKYFQQAYDRAAKSHFKKTGEYAMPIRTGASCDRFVGTVVHASGYDKKFTVNHDSMKKRMNKTKSLWKKVKTAGRGDICQKFFGNNRAHIKIYLGNGKIAEANSGVKSGDKRFGGVTSGSCKGYDIYRAVK